MQYVACLTSIYNLIIFECKLVAGLLQSSRHYCDAVVTNKKMIDLISANSLTDALINRIVALEISHIRVKKRLLYISCVSFINFIYSRPSTNPRYASLIPLISGSVIRVANVKVAFDWLFVLLYCSCNFDASKGSNMTSGKKIEFK